MAVSIGRVGLLFVAWMGLVTVGVAMRIVDQGQNGAETVHASAARRAPAHVSEQIVQATPPDAVNDENDSATDLYGNAVTDAVAKYKVDSTGSLFELHSPQTELPRLGPPKS